jgi:hypothetical protein
VHVLGSKPVGVSVQLSGSPENWPVQAWFRLFQCEQNIGTINGLDQRGLADMSGLVFSRLATMLSRIFQLLSEQ